MDETGNGMPEVRGKAARQLARPRGRSGDGRFHLEALVAEVSVKAEHPAQAQRAMSAKLVQSTRLKSRRPAASRPAIPCACRASSTQVTWSHGTTCV